MSWKIDCAGSIWRCCRRCYCWPCLRCWVGAATERVCKSWLRWRFLHLGGEVTELQSSNNDPLVHALVCPSPQLQALAQAVGARLGVAVVDAQPNLAADHLNAGFILQLDEQGLALQQLGRKPPGPVRVDFGAGAVEHRRKFGGGKGQMIAKAVGLNKGAALTVLDATAGLGKDGFVLASLGCQVQLLERSPVVAELLADGLRRGLLSQDGELREIVQRLTLQRGDSRTLLAGQVAAEFDIVYLDPMFPERSKSALVKKDMAAFHQLVGGDEDAGELLSLARKIARYRVVVKRPRKAPCLNQLAPTYQLTGKTSRYDIYVNAKIGI
ncbi:MAG: class I SAM-dependent methyltransferase [Gammaproteobacteria bacterium]|nr:class I SAM-dependent methyltransferase [Gammaproteobacteria bacterium]